MEVRKWSYNSNMILKFEDLEIYQLSYKLAVVLFGLIRKSKNFELVRESNAVGAINRDEYCRRFFTKI